MPIIVSLNGVFAVPIFRSCRRFGLAASLALLTSATLATAVEATETTSASRAVVSMSTTSPATIGTRRAARVRRRVVSSSRVSTPQVSSSRARRARLARAKAAQKAREYREAETPLFRTADDGSLVPTVRAEAAIVYNPVTQQVLWETNAQNERSIASITKVMTAVVFLEHALDLTQPVRIEKSDVKAASTTYLKANDVLTPQDLLHLLLIGSDNAAARALARTSPFGTEGFVEHMNAKARELGLEHTHYDDPSGLIDTNV